MLKVMMSEVTINLNMLGLLIKRPSCEQSKQYSCCHNTLEWDKKEKHSYQQVTNVTKKLSHWWQTS